MKMPFAARSWLISLTVTTFLVFGAIWTFADPIGLRQGWGLFLSLLVASVIIASAYTLIKSLVAAHTRIADLEELLSGTREELSNAQKKASYCCVLDQSTPFCPLGVTAINPHMETTITSSIQEAHRSFKWLGLSAFNVLHNNKQFFAQKKEIDFEFVTANPGNSRLANEVDRFYGDVKGTLGARKLIAESNALLADFADNVNPSIRVLHHNQMPTFRIILIDDRKAYISFYERGIDALKSVQLEIIDNPEAPYPIFKWFTMFYQKFLITEQLIAPKS